MKVIHAEKLFISLEFTYPHLLFQHNYSAVHTGVLIRMTCPTPPPQKLNSYLIQWCFQKIMQVFTWDGFECNCDLMIFSSFFFLVFSLVSSCL